MGPWDAVEAGLYPAESAGVLAASSPGLRIADHRAVHLVTRGNVDGIVSAALFFSRHPEGRVSFVPSATSAVDTLRKDLSTRLFYVVDLGLTPELIRSMNMKGKTGQGIVLLDHHQQSELYASELGPHVRAEVGAGGSAASFVLRHFGIEDPALQRLAALADIVEYGTTPFLDRAVSEWGFDRLEEEAVHLDFAWRLQIDDDRFRAMSARRLSRGVWPSEVGEIRRRYLQMLNENRWIKAKERVRSHLDVRNGVALLHFGKRKPSLLGFGTRALTSVAKEEGCDLAVLVNRRKELASVALRALADEPRINLGLFVEDFTRRHGIVGGGHPTSAGAKIWGRHLPVFLNRVYGYG
ncbi:MAG TPA: hypothetical protein VI997_12735 [Candidatus Thermoplasmatota archaeon]|nr:hypothetical protein [Candidatus Thermoplasmatota archaeon]